MLNLITMQEKQKKKKVTKCQFHNQKIKNIKINNHAKEKSKRKIHVYQNIIILNKNKKDMIKHK